MIKSEKSYVLLNPAIWCFKIFKIPKIFGKHRIFPISILFFSHFIWKDMRQCKFHIPIATFPALQVDVIRFSIWHFVFFLATIKICFLAIIQNRPINPYIIEFVSMSFIDIHQNIQGFPFKKLKYHVIYFFYLSVTLRTQCILCTYCKQITPKTVRFFIRTLKGKENARIFICNY